MHSKNVGLNTTQCWVKLKVTVFNLSHKAIVWRSSKCMRHMDLFMYCNSTFTSFLKAFTDRISILCEPTVLLGSRQQVKPLINKPWIHVTIMATITQVRNTTMLRSSCSCSGKVQFRSNYNTPANNNDKLPNYKHDWQEKIHLAQSQADVISCYCDARWWIFNIIKAEAIFNLSSSS